MSWKDRFPKENRYFETDNGILYCADCLKILKKFPNESIDLVLTDPPYLKRYSYLYIETSKIFANILKNDTFAIYYASDYWFADIFPYMLNFLDYFYLFHLLLPGQNALIFPKNIIASAKTIIVLMKGKAKLLKRVRNVVVSPERKTGELHKWQQSVEPALFFIENFSNKDDIVLDCFLGSGTTAIACEKLNRRWIGIEINPEYCEIAKQRILREIRQLEIELKRN